MVDADSDNPHDSSHLRPDGDTPRDHVPSNEARYRSLIHATASIVWRASPDGSVLEAPGSELFTGMGDDELKGWNWVEFLHPDDRVRIVEIWREAVVNRAVVHAEHRLRMVGGDYRWVAVRAVPVLDAEGEVLEWVGTVVDIHAQREATAALKDSQTQLAEELAAAERMQFLSTMLVQTDNDQGMFERVLDEAVALMRSEFASIQMLHPANGEEPERLQLLGFRGFSPESAKYWEWVLPTSSSTCGEALRVHARVVVPDIREFEYGPGSKDREHYDALGIRAVQTTPLVSRSGRLVGMVSTHWRDRHMPSAASLARFDVLARLAADFIERRRAMAEREQLLEIAERSREEAERANRAKDEFLAVLSHELRSPMNAMLGWLRILKTAGVHDADLVGKAADTIERNIHIQAQVINDLLDVSRLMSGKLQIEHERVDVGSVVMGCVETLRPAAEGKQVALRLRVDQDVDVVGDGARLEQVVANLVGNAIKFTPSGGFITVSVAGSNLTATIIVEDTGCGIEPAFLPQLFESFRQADSSTTRMHGGLGLGLAIVKNVIELHGGHVQADSDGAGRGSRFTVNLPRAEKRAPRSLRGARVAPAQTARDLAAVDVLVVDDDADSRVALELAFQHTGASVRSAESVRDALDAYRTRPPDVLISDIGMPGEDGYVLIRAIRERENGRPHHTFAIAVTGFAGRHDRETALRAGFDEHVAKPVEPQVLFERVRVLEASRGNGVGAGG